MTAEEFSTQGFSVRMIGKYLKNDCNYGISSVDFEEGIIELYYLNDVDNKFWARYENVEIVN